MKLTNTNANETPFFISASNIISIIPRLDNGGEEIGSTIDCGPRFYYAKEKASEVEHLRLAELQSIHSPECV